MKPARAAAGGIALALVAGGAWWFLRDETQRASARPEAPPVATSEAEPAQPAELDTDGADSSTTARAAISAPSAAPATRASAIRLRGRVIDDLGAPVDRYLLVLQFGPQDGQPDSRSIADPRGEFALDDVPDGEWTVRAVRSEGRVQSAPTVVRLPGSDTELVLVLPRAAKISGAVTTPVGASIEGASVYLRLRGDPDLDMRSIRPRVTTDARGRFAIDGVQPGAPLLMATHRDHADGEWTEVTASAGERVEIALVLADGGRIHGVIDAAEGELAGRQIDLFSFRGYTGWRTTKSDARGEFEILHVIPQDYVVELRPPGYPPGDAQTPGVRKRITVAEGATTEVVFGQIEPPLTVNGVVLCAGAPLANVDVTATALGDAEDRRARAKTGGDGRFALELGGEGRYVFRVEVLASYGSRYDVERDVARGDEIVLALPGGAIVGTVVGPNGAPLRRVSVSVLRDGESYEKDPASFWQNHREAFTHPDGTFEFRFLERGTYTLRAPDGNRNGPRSLFGGVAIVDLRVDGNVLERVVRLESGGRIEGRVVDARDQPVAEAAVQAFDASGVARSATWDVRTDATGAFALDSMAPGAYTIVARKGDQSATSARVQVTAGEIANALVRMP